MEKKDWIFLAVSLTIIVLIGIIVAGAYHFVDPVYRSTIGFYLKLIGLGLTILALSFTIFQQFQIKSKSKEIEAKTKNYAEAIRTNVYSWNVERAVNLSEKLMLALRNSNKNTCLFIITELQSILTKYKAISNAHYNSSLTNCLCCLSKEEYTQQKILELIDECKTKCRQEVNESIVDHNKKLSGIIVALEGFQNETFDVKEVKKISKKVLEVKDFLNEIKPDLIESIKAN